MPPKEAYLSEQPLPTFPCSICGRQFIKSSLTKHEKACKKLSSLNRKVFESGKQRASGSDITMNDVKRVAKEKQQTGGTFARPKTNWRERHETFIEAIAASKKVDHALKTGAPLPPPPKAKVPSDFVQCEHCGRNFNTTAAERHIPFCRDQQTKKVSSLKPATAAVASHARPLQAQRAPSAVAPQNATNTNKDGRPPPTASVAPSTAAHQPTAAPATRAGRSNSTSHKLASDRQAPSATKKNDKEPIARPTATSATADRSSHLPTPITRSNSAPRNAAVAPQRNVLKTPTPVQQRRKR